MTTARQRRSLTTRSDPYDPRAVVLRALERAETVRAVRALSDAATVKQLDAAIGLSRVPGETLRGRLARAGIVPNARNAYAYMARVDERKQRGDRERAERVAPLGLLGLIVACVLGFFL